MARIKGGPTGVASGKLGNVVFVVRDGKGYVRMAPKYSKNSWTPRQKQHRERFKKVNAFCTQCKFQFVRPIWNLLPGSASGYHMFLKANMPAFGQDGKLADHALLHFSDGVLPVPFHFKVETIENEKDKILVSWANDNLMSGKFDPDELWIATAFNNGFGGPYESGVNRMALKATIPLPIESTAVIAVYLFFASKDRKRFSPDRYFAIKNFSSENS